jgi:type IV fimbrial biogenesis protein FimT
MDDDYLPRKGERAMISEPQKGFTLIEVLMSVLVAAILLGLAVPSFTTFTKNRLITTQVNEFVSSLGLARSEALKRISRVTVCRSATGTSCADSGSWEQGWIVFNDKNNNGQVNATGDSDTNEQVLKYASTLKGGNTLKGSGNVAAYVSYVSTGNSKLLSGAFQSGTLALCDDRGVGGHARAITVNITGRARVESTAPDSCQP